MSTKTSDETKPKRRESTELLVAGLGIGTLGAVSAIVGAAVCPICVVASPALLGVGLYKRWKEHTAEAAANGEPAEGMPRSEP
jgi:hypothetical protein